MVAVVVEAVVAEVVLGFVAVVWGTQFPFSHVPSFGKNRQRKTDLPHSRRLSSTPSGRVCWWLWVLE